MLGPDHPNVATTLNRPGWLYDSQGRYSDALPLVQRLIREHRAPRYPTFSVLLQARAENLISPSQALTDSYEVVQRASSSAAGEAVSKLAARFAAGPDKELAALVRKEQDLTVEAEQLDKALIAALSKPAGARDAGTEDRVRKRIDAVKAERDKLQQVFNQRFPDYVALSKPQPVSVQDTQGLLADDEALIVFDFDAKSYVWIISKTNADWLELPIAAKDLDAQVKTLRRPMSDQFRLFVEPFDTALAYKIYQATFGVICRQDRWQETALGGHQWSVDQPAAAATGDQRPHRQEAQRGGLAGALLCDHHPALGREPKGAARRIGDLDCA